MELRGLPPIQVPPLTGRTLQVLVSATGATRVLEVGTLAGYSAIWMARGMPPGSTLLTLEVQEDRADLARTFVSRAGLDDRIEVRVGPAAQLLPGVGPDGSFDLVFLDADKEGYPSYLDHAARLLRVGGVVLADNAFWHGKVIGDLDEPALRGVQAFNRALAWSERFRSTILPVGDGLAMGVRVR